MPEQETIQVVQPATEAEVARVLNDARGRGLKVSPRGGGTKVSWEQPSEPADVVLSMSGLSRVLEHAAGDMTVTVEAGCTIAALQQAVARHGQRLALDPLWPDRATVGGVIATNDSGTLRAGYGSLRDLILGVTVALPDGTLAASGGKVVKNVAGYDLPKLMVGAFGTLGVVTRATFRLHPLPKATRVIQFTAPSPEHAQRFVLAMQASGPPVTGLQVEGGNDHPWSVWVRMEGSPAGVQATAPGVTEIANRCEMTPAEVETYPWPDRERVWFDEGAVVKVTFLPTRLAEVCRAIVAPDWRIVAQGVGEALLVLSHAYTDEGPERAERLAETVRGLGGSLVVLRGTDELKRRLDPLRNLSALPLMRRLREQFDPTGTLNPGRLGGGI